jgi:hypothetical protein
VARISRMVSLATGRSLSNARILCRPDIASDTFISANQALSLVSQ